MEAVISGSLVKAAEARAKQLEQAKAEFEKAVERAAARAEMRRKATERQYDAARLLARRVAGIRAGLWRQHHVLPTQELLVRLSTHEFRLSPAYAAQRLNPVSAKAERWYVRMIRSELARRGVRKEAA